MLDLPQVTSYDYDALLTEAGEPTEKYFHVQEPLKKYVLKCGKPSPAENIWFFRNIPCAKQRLTVGGKRPDDDGPRNDVSNNDGRSRIWLWVYALFSKLKNYHHENKLKVVEASDRLHLLQTVEQTIQYQENLGKK